MTGKRAVRIASISLGVFVLALVAALALVPYLFKDQIVERVRSELNERLDATVELADIDLSLLSTFPTLTVEVEELAIIGKDVFEGIELLRARSIGAGLDLGALVFGDEIRIESVRIESPRVHVVVTANGAANYDILGDLGQTDDAPTESETPLVVEIEDYEIRDATLIYEEPGIDVAIVDLDHGGRFRVAGSNQTLRSETEIEELSVRLGGVRYLKNAHAELDLEALLEGAQERLTVESLSLAINRLAMTGSGSVGFGGESLDLDLAFASEEGLPVKALVSAIPNAYAADFDGLQTGGSFSLKGGVKGQLGPEDGDIPSFNAATRVRNGRLKYPDLPLAITDIELDAKVDHPGGPLDKLTAEVAEYGLAAGESRASGRARIARPLSGPNVDFVLDGRFDLAELVKAYPIPDVESMAGIVEADVDLSAKGERIAKLSGAISATDLTYQPEAGATIEVAEAQVSLSPTQTMIKTLRVNVGSSDAQIRGVAAPLTAFLSEDELITASVWLRSKRLVVEDFLGESDETEEDDSVASAPFVLPDDVDARLDLDVETLAYGDLVLKNFKGSGRLKDRKLTLNGIRADALGGSMKLDGALTTRPDRAPAFDMTYVVERVSFAEAFKALPSMRAYAPIARFLDGRFSTDLSASGTLQDDFSPKLDSVDASGMVAALQSKLESDFGPLQELARALPAIPKPLDIEGFRTRFKIEDGAVEVKPFTAKAKGLEMVVSGRHGLDQDMKYRVTTEVPIDGLSSKLAAEVKRLGLDLTKIENIGVQANLTGSIESPRVSVDVDTGALRGAVADAISSELAEQRARAMEKAREQADQIVAEAKKQSQRVLEEAERAAERVRAEGYKRADQLEREAEGNPLQEIAAREGAKRIRRETDKRVDQALAEAERKADKVVAEAEKRADRLVEEAAAQSDRAADQVEQQTSDRIR